VRDLTYRRTIGSKPIKGGDCEKLELLEEEEEEEEEEGLRAAPPSEVEEF
jgi:hypothetical protein